jgi:hypothetical protein
MEETPQFSDGSITVAGIVQRLDRSTLKKNSTRVAKRI